MDQVSTSPRQRATPTSSILAAPTTSEASADSGEEPDSPGRQHQSEDRRTLSQSASDPLAEPVAALLGACLALLSLLVPLAAVLNDRRNLPAGAEAGVLPNPERPTAVEAFPSQVGWMPKDLAPVHRGRVHALP
jgi:hypothetical protein